MGPGGGTFKSALVLGLVGFMSLAAVLSPAGPAAVSAKSPTVKFVSPVCVNGLDVSVNGTVNWKTGGVGTVSVNWGDGTTDATSIPSGHVYGVGGNYTITLTATNTKGPGSATSIVNVGPTSTTCSYTLSPQPMAVGGTLPPGGSAPAVLKVTNAKGKAVASSEPVWLSFVPTVGGGTASVCRSGLGGSKPLTATPTLFLTGVEEPAGEVVINYTSSATPPDSGSDVVTAAGVPTPGASGSTSTSYQYSTSPVLFSPPPTIASDCSVDVSKSLGPWLRSLPPNSTVVPPPGACYQVDEGLSLNFPTGLTIDGGTYENDSTAPAKSTGSGTQRGDPVFNILGGSAVTLDAMTIKGVNPGPYNAKMAFAGGIELQGTSDATITNDTISGTYGDGITLDPLRNGSDHKGSGIVFATDNVTISNVTITGPGRMGISFVSVSGATVTNVTVTNVGLDTFDVEADQGNEGTRNLTIDGCTATTTGMGDFFADGGSGSGNSTGNITVSNCTMEEAQAGTAIWVDRPSTGTNPRGPYLFEDDTFECGASTTVACVIVSGGTVTVTDSTLDFPGTTPAETVYQALLGSTLNFTNDDATGYGLTATDPPAPGTNDSMSTVTVTGGTWTPAS